MASCFAAFALARSPSSKGDCSTVAYAFPAEIASTATGVATVSDNHELRRVEAEPLCGGHHAAKL